MTKKIQKVRESQNIVKDLREIVKTIIEGKMLYYCPIMTCNYSNHKIIDVENHIMEHKFDEIIGAIKYYS